MIGTKSKLTVDNTENKVVLIDADSLLYFSSYGSEEDQLLCETKLSEKIYDILNIVGNSYNVEKYYVFVKGKNNFRYKIFPEYKKNRPPKNPIIDVLNYYLVSEFGAIESHNAESDDYVFSYSQLPEYQGRAIICSVDKDMLQIPGIHYDYQKNKFHVISEDDARYNLAIQMIMGDAADGIAGLRGYGPKKAEKIITKGMTNYQCAKAILKEYLKNYPDAKSAKEAVRLNYKLLKLQRVHVETLENEPSAEFA
jgi:5'-3' exonuclease